jgi:hypothetical protein
MADEKNDLARFGWNSASEIEYQDDDGNWVRGGDIPPEVQEILDKHAEELKKAKAKDARMKTRPKVKVHIHRK